MGSIARYFWSGLSLYQSNRLPRTVFRMDRALGTGQQRRRHRLGWQANARSQRWPYRKGWAIHGKRIGRGTRYCAGQRKVDEKSNDITAMPELLDVLAVEDCVITIHA